MPFTGKAEVVESRVYHTPTGGRVSLFSSYVPEGSVLVTEGWTIRWSDGTVGTCKPAMKTKEEADAYAEKWNSERAAAYAAAGQEDPYA